MAHNQKKKKKIQHMRRLYDMNENQQKEEKIKTDLQVFQTLALSDQILK